ncbi:MAG: PAS domain S-box protein [Coriobacteriia bacterium]|nr:PAS domain S-box protein [Coriobacteriia bacterium]MBN2822379.1 PAS domain S-box protein [Coriobacteriia bacterium]
MIGKGSFGEELLAYLQLLPITTIIVRMVDTKIVWGSPQGLSLIGASDPSEVIGKRVLDLIPPEQHGVALRNAALLVAGASSIPSYVYTLNRLDGTTTPVHIESVLITFKGALSMLTIVVDVSERESALIELTQSEARYRSLVESSPDAILVSVGDEIVYANPSAISQGKTYGIETLLGHSVFDFLPPDRTDHADRLRQLYTEGGTLSWIETDIHYAQGHSFPVEIHTTLISWHGEPATQTVVRDVSQCKAAAAKLEEYKGHLEQLVDERTRELERAMADLESVNFDLVKANAAKSSFMAAMSHELRTPLNSIIGFSAILEQGLAGELNEEQAKQIEIINGAGRQLLGLVGNVLDLERIESGRTEVTFRQLAPRDTATKLVEMVRPLAETKGLHVTCVSEADFPERIRTDQLKLEQILMNLLVNGIKYTDAGSVTLKMSSDSEALRFAVADTGPGVELEQRELVFEEFYQFSAHDNVAKPSGAGLGLAIARRLAGLLGGRLWLESEMGVGSTFTLELPLG